jgi:WD40 repeat protein
LDCKRVGKFAHEVSSVAIYDVKTGVLCRRLAAGIFGEISDVKVVQDLVVTASQDGIIKIWHAVDTSLIKMRLSYSDACKLLWLTPAFSDCRTRSDKRNEQ